MVVLRLYFWDTCWKLENIPYIPTVYKYPNILTPLSTQLLSVLSAMGLVVASLGSISVAQTMTLQ